MIIQVGVLGIKKGGWGTVHIIPLYPALVCILHVYVSDAPAPCSGVQFFLVFYEHVLTIGLQNGVRSQPAQATKPFPYSMRVQLTIKCKHVSSVNIMPITFNLHQVLLVPQTIFISLHCTTFPSLSNTSF